MAKPTQNQWLIIKKNFYGDPDNKGLEPSFMDLKFLFDKFVNLVALVGFDNITDTQWDLINTQYTTMKSTIQTWYNKLP